MADTYRVISQEPITAAAPGGTFVPSILVTFATKPTEIVGKVTIPQTGYGAEAVDAAIRASVEVLEAVQAL